MKSCFAGYAAQAAAWLALAMGSAACDRSTVPSSDTAVDFADGDEAALDEGVGDWDVGGDHEESDSAEGVCGDNLISMGEQCDGADLGGAGCASLGYIGGELACSPDCRFDSDGCLSADELLAGDGERPGIAVAPDKSVHVVYVRDGVRYRSIIAGSLGPEELVYAGRAHWPHAAASGDGDVHVVWEEGTLLERIWYARRLEGVWTVLPLHAGNRALMPKIALDSQGRAHTLFWSIDGEISIGKYNRVVLSGDTLAIDLTRDVIGWDPNRDGDIIVDGSDVVHVFAGRPGGINHWTVSESGEFTPAEGMTKPDEVDNKTGELFDAALGPGGVFYAACAGITADDPPQLPAVHFRSNGPSQVVWPDIGDAHTAVTTAADLLVAGRAFVIFAGTDRIGRIAVVDEDGTVTGPTPFADAGEQSTGAPRERFASVGDGVPGEEGLWIAYQDNRSGSWQIYLRRLTVAFIQGE